jgi:hypothetical protein
MKTTTAAAGALLAALALAGGARADEWDVGNDTDGALTTDNVPSHRAEQVHDLAAAAGVADQDWFLLPAHPFSSYEFLVDGMTGDLQLAGADVSRLTDGGTTVADVATALEGGGVLSLRWAGPPSEDVVRHWVRVQGATCGTACDQSDRYRARFYDTTYTIPRFNNSGTQSTVLLIQNATDRACAVTAFLLDRQGTVVTTLTSTANPHQLLVLPTASVAPNASGSVRVTHDCGYGGLSGKAVSIEPATGFTFDTALSPRP